MIETFVKIFRRQTSTVLCFIIQLTHTTLKKVTLLQHFKISKTKRSRNTENVQYSLYVSTFNQVSNF